MFTYWIFSRPVHQSCLLVLLKFCDTIIRGQTLMALFMYLSVTDRLDKLYVPTPHCKCLHTNYRLIIIFICYYYTWKCVKCLKVVDFENYRQLSVFPAANSKLHTNHWYLDVKWNCILIYSKIRYINWLFLQLKICN